jgi:glutathione S-transferase
MEKPMMAGSDSGDRPVLFTCARSRGLRASWTAQELGIALEYRMLPFPPRRRAPDYLVVNPLGTVPALLHEGQLLTESVAIAHYLATRWGPSPLSVSPGEADYGAFLDFLHHAEATITFPQTVWMRFGMMEKERGLEAAGLAYAEWYGQRLAKVEQHVADREFLCADRFTVADVAVSYALYLSSLNGLDHLVTPAARAYRERMTARSAFTRAIETEIRAAAEQGVD